MSAEYGAYLGSMGVAAFGSGVLTIVFTTPQIVNLSQQTNLPLPKSDISILKKHGRNIFKRAIATQTLNKIIHFGSVRFVKQQFDKLPGGGLGKYNLNVAYGLIAVPVQAWAYNSLNAEVFQYFGQSKPAQGSFLKLASDFFRTKIRPGFFWNFLRDSNSVGGGLILGPIFAAKIAAMRRHGDQGDGASPAKSERLVGGLFAGIICGLGTQMFHNAALTAGRAAVLGTHLGTIECMKRLWIENGFQCVFQGYHYRVAVIAGMSALLNLCEPFK